MLVITDFDCKISAYSSMSLSFSFFCFSFVFKSAFYLSNSFKSFPICLNHLEMAQGIKDTVIIDGSGNIVCQQFQFVDGIAHGYADASL